MFILLLEEYKFEVEEEGDERGEKGTSS